MKKKALSLLFGILYSIVLFSNTASAAIVVEEFEKPDIKNDFCGAMIDFRYCKCGFHGDKDFCKQIGQSESSADSIVQDKFSAYVDDEKNRFKNNCENNNGILSGDTCTWCTEEHFRYKDTCVTNEEMCGTEDPYLFFDVDAEKCLCIATYEKGENGLCEKEKIVEIQFDWIDEEPPLFADGETTATANVSVKALKMKDKPLVPVEFVLTTSSRGELEVEETGENEYQITYKTPDLRGSDPSKNYRSGINLNFTVKDGKKEDVETDEVVIVPLAIETPVKISAFGFETQEKNIVLKGGEVTAEVNIIIDEDEDEYYPISGAKIELPDEKIYTTDQEGEVEIKTENEFLKGETEDMEFNLIVGEEVNKQLSQAKTRVGKIGAAAKSTEIQSFLDDFIEDLATAENDTERRNLVDGLKRLNYALFFVEKGEDFGKTSADSLANVTKEAVKNMVDLLDSVLGITGKITDKINSKGAKLGDRAIQKISEQVDEVYKAALKKLGAAMQAGVSQYAPESGVHIGGLLRFLEDKFMISDNIKAKTAGQLDLHSGIKEYFEEQVREASYEYVSEIDAFLTEGRENGFPTLEYSSDLESAKGNYAQLADKYIKAEQGEYWRSMTKAWFDLGFDTVGKGVSIVFPIYATVIGQVENMYKAARSGFLDSANMFQWYKTHGDIMKEVERGVLKSLGEEIDYQTYIENKSRFGLLPTAYAENTFDSSEFMDAVADVEMYNAFAEIGKILSEEFPEEAEEFNVEIEKLKGQSEEAAKKIKTLEKEAGKNIPETEFEFWGISEEGKQENKQETLSKSAESEDENGGSGAWVVILVLAGGFGGYTFWKKRKGKK